MPQMSPMNWIFIIMFSSMILTIILITLHFSQTSSNFSLNIPTQKHHFPWKW